MNKLIKYISFLLIVISCTYITREVINFRKDIILLESHQAEAVIKKDRMLRPSVRITITTLSDFELDTASPIEKGISIEEYLLNNLNYAASSATGFSVKYDSSKNISYIITNDHFCESYEDESMLTIDHTMGQENLSNDSRDLTGHVAYSDPSIDLCLVIAYGHIKPAQIANYEYDPKEFETIYVVGAPGGNFPVIIDTYISGFLDRNEVSLGELSDSGYNYMIISEQIIPGHSGSAVFNKKGEVIGIMFATMGTYGGLAISHRDLYKLMEDYGEKF